MKKYKIRQADSIEEAISVVLKEDTECQTEWYDIGRTLEELQEYLGKIDFKKLGVVISGKLEAPFEGKITCMPESWVKR